MGDDDRGMALAPYGSKVTTRAISGEKAMLYQRLGRTACPPRNGLLPSGCPSAPLSQGTCGSYNGPHRLVIHSGER
jgi:hypothetical protein